MKRKSIGKRLRFRVLARSNFSCVYCGTHAAAEVQLVVDHVIPIALGGTNDETNLAASCEPCNQGKGATSIVAAGATFLGWLRMQRDRDDWVGDLADGEKQRMISVEPTSYREFAHLLSGRGACQEALHSAWHAWREWKRGQMTRATRGIHNELRKDIRENATSGVCLHF
jgi:hypothetical protein